MEKHFYFFRHGQTNENKAGKREGTGIDSYLTEIGEFQASKLSDYLADKGLDVIFTSPYKRAIDTAEIVASRHENVSIIQDKALCEIAFGFWEPSNDKAKKEMECNYKKIQSFLQKISFTSKYCNIAVSSHGGVTRALCYAAGRKLEGIKNCQCFHFILKNGTFIYKDTFDTGIDVVNISDKY